jgi:hypothetical protein
VSKVTRPGDMEMRNEEPTTYLIWDDGVLVQQWRQEWAEWTGNYWHRWTEHVWKPVPQKPTP